MVVLIVCKNDEDRIKIEGARVHNILHLFFRRSMDAHSVVRGN